MICLPLRCAVLQGSGSSCWDCENSSLGGVADCVKASEKATDCEEYSYASHSVVLPG